MCLDTSNSVPADEGNLGARTPLSKGGMVACSSWQAPSTAELIKYTLRRPP